MPRRNWAIHAASARATVETRVPSVQTAAKRYVEIKYGALCGQTTGHGARGCDQALVTIRRRKVTCKKCKKLLRRADAP